MWRGTMLLAVLVGVTILVGAETPTASAQQPPAIVLTELPHQFAFITEIATAGDGSGRLYVAEKRGTIRVVEADGSLHDAFFLDIREDVGDQGAEQGLLGLAFSPAFATDRLFYVNYTNTSGDTRVERYRANSARDADETSGEVVLAVDQPAANHNGGHLTFGPDGWLWIGMGDGGGSGDTQNHAQTDGDRLGKLLRYNPANGAIEQWAKGLRNPWKFTFDTETSDLYIADVGQNTWEEVNFVPAGAGPGLNFGWPITEGDHCFPPNSTCSNTGLELPVNEYSRDQGCSVTGGYVVREAGSVLYGTYLFSDYCSGTIWGLRRVPEGSWERELLGSAPGNVSTFGQSEDGAVYVAAAGAQGSQLFRVRASPEVPRDLPIRGFVPAVASDR